MRNPGGRSPVFHFATRGGTAGGCDHLSENSISALQCAIESVINLRRNGAAAH